MPNETEACWQLHAGAWIVLIAGEAELGATQHTLIVADLDGFLSGARSRGVEAEPARSHGAGMRQSVIVDPDGNRLKVAAPA